MDNFLQEQPASKSRSSGVIIGALLAAVAIIAGGFWLLTFLPTSEEQRQQQFAGMVYEGSPEFDEYTKQLIVTTNFDRTSQARLGLGTIQMSIHGTIRNKGTKTLNGLEVTVGVVDTQNKILKERKIVVVPNQSPTIQPNETIPVFVSIDGFSKEDDRANIRWKVTAIRFAS